MPDANTLQTNFSSGELSPAMLGRVDIAKYFNGAQQLENFYVKPQGGAFRRTGTKYVGATKSGSKVLLVDFTFNNTQAYVLEFGNLYCRIYKDGGRLTSLTAATVAPVPAESSPYSLDIVTPYTENDLAKLCWAQSADTLYLAHPDYAPRVFTRSSTSNANADSERLENGATIYWSIGKFRFKDGPFLDSNIDSTTRMSITLTGLTGVDQSTALVSTSAIFAAGDVAASRRVEFRDPFANDWQLGQVSVFTDTTHAIVQLHPVKDGVPAAYITYSGGLLHADHTGVFTRDDIGKYCRTDAGTWHIIQIDTANTTQNVKASSAMPLVSYTYPATIVSVSGFNRSAHVVASGSVFSSTDVNRFIRLNFTGAILYAQINSYISATEVNLSLIPYLDTHPENYSRLFPRDVRDASNIRDAGVTANWQLGAWYEGNWPSCVTIHQQRLCFAATASQPQNIWMSEAGNYPSFLPTTETGAVLDTSAINYQIASGQPDSIVWMESGPTLLIGTIGSEWQVKASTISEPLTPTNIQILPTASFYGSPNYVRPVRAGNSLIHLQRSARKCRELAYDYQNDNYVSRDITILAEHILRKITGVTKMVYQKEPNNIIWFLSANGTLAGLTWDKEQDVYSWHRHFIAGGVVESICCIPNTNGTANDLYLSVRRSVNGSTVRYVELMAQEFQPTSATDKAFFFVDCHLYGGPYAGTLEVPVYATGLDHLIGETVQIIADGTYIGDQVVDASGRVIVSQTVTTLVAGLPYSSTIVTMPSEGGTQAGTSQGARKRIHRISMRLLNSIGMKIGLNEQTLRSVEFRHTADVMDPSPNLFTGDKNDIQLEMDYSSQGEFWIRQDLPYPLNILAIMPQLKAYK